ncbi:MAG: 50S ribosomal protein L29 [Campylobacter sp.]|nr:50S ribosomal protein L29 [Campylobacter sp.]
MNYTDIKDKSLDELNSLLKEKKVQLFNLRRQLKTMQLRNTGEIKEVRKDIARINTAINAGKGA